MSTSYSYLEGELGPLTQAPAVEMRPPLVHEAPASSFGAAGLLLDLKAAFSFLVLGIGLGALVVAVVATRRRGCQRASCRCCTSLLEHGEIAGSELHELGTVGGARDEGAQRRVVTRARRGSGNASKSQHRDALSQRPRPPWLLHMGLSRALKGSAYSIASVNEEGGDDQRESETCRPCEYLDRGGLLDQSGTLGGRALSLGTSRARQIPRLPLYNLSDGSRSEPFWEKLTGGSSRDPSPRSPRSALTEQMTGLDLEGSAACTASEGTAPSTPTRASPVATRAQIAECSPSASDERKAHDAESGSKCRRSVSGSATPQSRSPASQRSLPSQTSHASSAVAVVRMRLVPRQCQCDQLDASPSTLGGYEEGRGGPNEQQRASEIAPERGRADSRDASSEASLAVSDLMPGGVLGNRAANRVRRQRIRASPSTRNILYEDEEDPSIQGRPPRR